MRCRRLIFASLLSVACGGDAPEKDSAGPDPCLTYVDEWSACTTAAGEGIDPTLEDPEAFCEERISRMKTPKDVEFIDQIPRNANGKVLKTELRKRS